MSHWNLKNLMGEAIERCASDLHLVVGSPPTFRIDGRIRRAEGPDLAPADIQELLGPLLSPAQATALMKRQELDFAWEEPDLGRFRASIFRERGSLSGAFRVVPSRIPTPEELGLPPAIRELATRSHGLVLIAGAVGNGKSTTMNALIEVINTTREGRVITIEDPVEFVHHHKKSLVLQRELNLDTRSFHKALVAALRQDPNVICIGEMRDRRTVATAITAAETGHLVISTLHTFDTAHTIDRIMDVFPPHQQSNVRLQLANTLEGVITQRLLPRASGDGRVLAYEVLVSTSATRRLIRDGKYDQLHNALTTGRSHGMMLMDHCVLNLYEQGVISRETARVNLSDAAMLHEPVMAGV